MTPSSPIPRPVRNNNPLDLDSGVAWLGLMPPGQMTRAQAREPRFAVFQSAEFGFRAGVVLLRNYWRLHGLRSLGTIIPRLAPPGENNSGAYISAVARMTGFGSSDLLDMESSQVLRALVKACATVETGSWAPWWNDGQLDRGLAMVFNGGDSV